MSSPPSTVSAVSNNLVAQSPPPSSPRYRLGTPPLPGSSNNEHRAATSKSGAVRTESIPYSPKKRKAFIKNSNTPPRTAVHTPPIPSWPGGGSSEPSQRPPFLRGPLSRPAASKADVDAAATASLNNHTKKRALPAAFSARDLEREDDIKKRTRLASFQDYHIDLSNLPGQREGTEPPSPLFFSNSPHRRPVFPPRLSSFEAEAAIMKKANIEDSSGVRTVKMARGPMHYGMASSPRAMSTPSPAGLAFNRLNSPREMSVDERNAASGGLQALAQVGILELLDQDDRVVFIIDLANRTVSLPGPLQMVFVNAALKSYSSLLDIVRGRIKDETSELLATTTTFPEFKAWVTSFVKNNEAMDVSLPAFTFAGVTWNCASLKKRFRVLSGNAPSFHSSMISSPSTAVVNTLSTTLAKDASDSQAKSAMDIEEPKDYFGNAQVSTWLDEQQLENEGPEGPDPEVVSSMQSPTSVHDSIAIPARINASESARKDVDAGTAENVASDEAPSSIVTRPVRPIRGATTTAPGNASEHTYTEPGFFDWTRLPLSPALPRHIQFARSIDWAATPLGPIEQWPLALRSMCNLIMASPNPAAMYWGDEFVAIYNEAYILLAGQKHPRLMGLPYSEAWPEIWDSVKDSFASAKNTGQSTMKDDDCLFMDRAGYLEETYFSWSIIPLVGEDGSVVGLYNPAFEKTRRKIAERRMLTLREVGERTAAAREVKGFWGQVLKGLEENEHDTPFVLLYSVSDDSDSDASSIHSNSILSAKSCLLEGSLPPLPPNHKAAPSMIDLKSGNEGFGPIFREAMTMDKPVLLETANGTLDDSLIEGIDYRGFKEKPRAAVVCPIHPTTGDSIIGFLVMGINPRRPYDDDYNLFVQLLGRQLATSMAAVVLFEEEIRRGQRAAKLAALDRIDLSEQLAARTKEVVESETKFTRMAEFAPVGMFIADRNGRMTFTNEMFHSISQHPREEGSDHWMNSVHDEDKAALSTMWDDLIRRCQPLSAEFRFKKPWEDRNGIVGDNWVLASAYPEKADEGNLEVVFGSITNISQQKWAEDYQRQRMEEAVELKRQQTNFMDMTSHEMRNPLSAILQCADEISGSLIEFKTSHGKYNIPEALLDSNIDAAQTIALCANHQTRIVSDVLTLSKMDSALLLVTPVDARPATIVQQAVKMFDGELQTSDIKMSTVIDKSFVEAKIDWVRLDPSRLLQVLINLTTNAIKFTTAQQKRAIVITLSAYSEPPSRLTHKCVDYIPAHSKRDDLTDGKDWGDGQLVYLHFSVADTGKGLTEAEKKLLFLRFSQASPKTHVRYGGSGLGLFISRELVELQGGEIGVSSESGEGSTFAFYVKARVSSGPLSERNGTGASAATSGSSKARKNLSTKSGKAMTSSNIHGSVESIDDTAGGLLPSPTPSNLENLKVLIVEDNLVNQRVLCKQLRNLGCTVYLANHGGECIDYLRRTKYWSGHEQDGIELSLILMDLEMPVMDGLTCTRKIREYEKSGAIVNHVPILAVSANARNAHIESALAAGMDDVVSKPFRIPELMPKVEQLVRRYAVTSPNAKHITSPLSAAPSAPATSTEKPSRSVPLLNDQGQGY